MASAPTVVQRTEESNMKKDLFVRPDKNGILNYSNADFLSSARMWVFKCLIGKHPVMANVKLDIIPYDDANLVVSKMHGGLFFRVAFPNHENFALKITQRRR